MTRAAAWAEAAADAVLAWLRDQARAGAAATQAVRAGGPPGAASTEDDGGVVQDAPAARSAERAVVERCPAPMRLAHTDWLHHRLAVTGPADQLAAPPRARASSPGNSTSTAWRRISFTCWWHRRRRSRAR